MHKAQRLIEVRKWLRENHWRPEVFPWERKVEERERAERANGANQIMFALECALHDGVLTKGLSDIIFTMVHASMVERGTFDSKWGMNLPTVGK